jgi:hypothetical protein
MIARYTVKGAGPWSPAVDVCRTGSIQQQAPTHPPTGTTASTAQPNHTQACSLLIQLKDGWGNPLGERRVLVESLGAVRYCPCVSSTVLHRNSHGTRRRIILSQYHQCLCKFALFMPPRIAIREARVFLTSNNKVALSVHLGHACTLSFGSLTTIKDCYSI